MGPVRLNQLQGEQLPQLEVACSIDKAHPAVTQLALYSILFVDERRRDLHGRLGDGPIIEDCGRR